MQQATNPAEYYPEAIPPDSHPFVSPDMAQWLQRAGFSRISAGEFISTKTDLLIEFCVDAVHILGFYHGSDDEKPEWKRIAVFTNPRSLFGLRTIINAYTDIAEELAFFSVEQK